MAKAKPQPIGRDALPKRFQPLFDQADVETRLRYGAQENALGSILQQSATNYGRQSAAQSTASQTLLGALKTAAPRLTQAYSDAGLTPAVLQQIASSPTGQRLAGELASGQAGIQQQALGAQAGQQYLQQHLYDGYRDDVNQIGGQLQSLGQERGLYQSSLLDQLITGDRSARHSANEAAKTQQHADTQAVLDRATQTGNALIGQGITPVINDDGSVTLGPAIPGGKADPNAPANKNKNKRTSGAGTASPDAQRSAGTDFSKALGLARGLTNGLAKTPEARQGTAGILTNGKPATSAKTVYESVPTGRTGTDGKPIMKRQPKVQPAKLPDGSPNPLAGQQVTSTARPAVPAFDAPIANAATEQAMFGYVTTKTVRELQKLGYSVNEIPGLKTQAQAQKSKPRTKTAPAPRTRSTPAPRNAPTGYTESRPT